MEIDLCMNLSQTTNKERDHRDDGLDKGREADSVDSESAALNVGFYLAFGHTSVSYI